MIGGEQNPLDPMVSAEEIQAEAERFLFDSFTRKDALELGMIMQEKQKGLNMAFSVMIKFNGLVVFQYLPEGTGGLNLAWMEKKIRTVEMMNCSTMALWVGMNARGIKRDPTELLPISELVMCGGGFPIRLKSGEVVGAVAVSGPGDQNDHFFCVECFDEFIRRSAQ